MSRSPRWMSPRWALTQGLLEAHLRRGGMVVLTTHQDAPITAPSMQTIELGT